MHRILAVMACMLLAGCLTTTKPVFDASNSIKAGDSKAFVAFVDAWEKRMGKKRSPRALIAMGARIVERGGMMIVEMQQGPKILYMAVGWMGKRQVACMVHHKGIEQMAKRHGVEAKAKGAGSIMSGMGLPPAKSKEPKKDDDKPKLIEASGDKAKLHAFIMDAFDNGRLHCQVQATPA